VNVGTGKALIAKTTSKILTPAFFTMSAVVTFRAKRPEVVER
jgi:hypothetical protein